MKNLVTLILVGIATVGRAGDIEPAVDTSGGLATPTASPAAAAAPAATTAAAPAATPPPARPARPKSRAPDQILLDTTQITGNRELPNVMYVVPWKKPELGDFGGRPPKSLLDELLAPVDREVFRRQNRYFAALQPDAAAAPAGPVTTPPAGAATTLPSGDEK